MAIGARRLIQVMILTLVISIGLQAEIPFKLWRLLLTKHCEGCRLVDVELRHVNLAGANLKNADLRWAKFESVDLSHADLSGANQRQAKFDGVVTYETNFCGATMMNASPGYCS